MKRSAEFLFLSLLPIFVGSDSLYAEISDGSSPPNTQLGFHPGNYSTDKVFENKDFEKPNYKPLPGTWRPFNDQSPWNTPIGLNPKIHVDSGKIVDRLVVGAEYFRYANSYVPPIWVINSNNIEKMKASALYPFDVWDPGLDKTTERVMPMEFGSDNVPIMYGENASDGHIVIVDPFTHILYEMSYFRRGEELNTSTGNIQCSTFNLWDLRGNGVGDSAEGNRWSARGARGSGFPVIAGLVRPEQFDAGEIPHAIVFAFEKNRAGVYLSPAARSDGSSSESNTPIEGMRFQLDPSLTDSDFDSWGLNREGKILARAMQKYGLFDGDNGGAMTLQAVLLDKSSDTSRDMWNTRFPDFWRQPNKIPVRHLRALDTGPELWGGQRSTVIRPLILPVSGSFVGSQSVTMESATSSATIYYTTDGSKPSTSSHRYNGSITINSTTDLKAIAVKSGMKDSEVTRAPLWVKGEAPPNGSGTGQHGLRHRDRAEALPMLGQHLDDGGRDPNRSAT